MKVANDNRVQLKPDNVDTNLSLKYNSRTMILTIYLHLRISVHPIAWKENPDEESGDDTSILIADSEVADSEKEFSDGPDD